MLIPKHRNIRLHGQAKSDLRDAIFERDNYSCVICHHKATEWHHQPFGSSKSDEINKGVALCKQCHTDLHSHPKLGSIYQKLVQEYLEGIYGTDNQRL